MKATTPLFREGSSNRVKFPVPPGTGDEVSTTFTKFHIGPARAVVANKARTASKTAERNRLHPNADP
jgi:hypothetical protein